MFSAGEKTEQPSQPSLAVANNLSDAPQSRGVNLVQTKGKDVGLRTDGAVVQMVGKKGHIAIGAAVGTIVPVVGNIVGGLIGYAVWKHKQKQVVQAPANRIIMDERQGPRRDDKEKEPVREDEMPATETMSREDRLEIKQEIMQVVKEEGPVSSASAEGPTEERATKKGDPVPFDRGRLGRMAAWLEKVKELIQLGDFLEAYQMLKDPDSARLFGVTVAIDGAMGDAVARAKRNIFARQANRITLNMPADVSWVTDERTARVVMPMHLEEYMHAYQSKSGGFLSASTGAYKKTGELERSGARIVGGHADYDEIDVMSMLHDWGFNVEEIGYVERYSERKKFWAWKQQQPTQLRSMDAGPAQQKAFQPPGNRTGMPDQLKTGVEGLSGFDLSDVKVHYNSSRPAQLNAFAYAQGTDIHLAPGQERHLPHEAWHVVQQKQGRVQPTTQLKNSVSVNDDPALEQEADVMGQKAIQASASPIPEGALQRYDPPVQRVVQRTLDIGGELYDLSRMRHLAVPLNERYLADAQFKIEFDKVGDEFIVEGGLKWGYITDPRIGLLLSSSDRYGFPSWGHLEASIKGWDPGSEAIPRDIQQRFKMPVNERKFDGLRNLEAAVRALGSRPELLGGVKIDSRWTKLVEAKTKIEALVEIQSLWGVCGSSAQTLIERLWAVGGQPTIIHDKSHVDKQDAADLGTLLLLPVASTTFYQINEPLIHQFTVEKRPDGRCYLHQGFISNYNALWWAGMAKDVAPHLSLKGDNAAKMIAERERSGGGRDINIGALARGLRAYLETLTHGKASERIWATLPLNPVASEEMRWEGQPVILNVKIFQLGDEATARKNLQAHNEGLPLIQAVMRETKKLLDGKEGPESDEKEKEVPRAMPSASMAIPSVSDARPAASIERPSASMAIPAANMAKPVPVPRAGPVVKPGVASEEPKPLRPPVSIPVPAVVQPNALAIDRRWEEATLAVPAGKLEEWKFTDSLQSWNRSNRSEAMRDWSVRYLDWLDGQLMAEGNALKVRWDKLNLIMKDLSLSRTLHVRIMALNKEYAAWEILHGLVTRRAGRPSAKEYLEGPTEALDAFERDYKGKVQWKDEVVRWKLRDGYLWS